MPELLGYVNISLVVLSGYNVDMKVKTNNATFSTSFVVSAP
jgi:hypothetical protein